MNNKIGLIIAAYAAIALVTGCTTTALQRTPHTMKSDGEVPAVQQGLRLTHADLSFDIYPQQQAIQGSATLSLSTEFPRNALGLDLDSFFAISSVSIDGQLLSPQRYANPEGLLRIDLEKPVSGRFDVTVVYHGKPRVAVRAPWDGGFVWSKSNSGQHWIATAVQGEGCDLFWPCIDYPVGEPQQVSLHITVPADLTAAANGVLTNVEDKGDRKTFHWQTRSQHNTYGVAINIGPYDVIEQPHDSVYGNRYPVVYYHLPESADKAPDLVSEMHQMLDFYERTIGPYPFAGEKMGVVETPHLGMEHQTINAYGNGYKKDEYGFDWLLHHELAHEWFANQLTNTNANHMWLHEGFGTYMQPLYAEYLHGRVGYMAYLYKIRTQINNKRPIVGKQPASVEQVYTETKGPAIDIYYKGAWVLHTLRQLIGDDAFFDATRELVYGTRVPMPGEFTPRLADTQGFIEIVNRVTGADYQWFFDVYLYQAALPELVQSRTQDELTLSWNVAENLPFPLPVDVSINGIVTTMDLAAVATLAVKPKDIVVVDPHSKILKREPHIQAFQAFKRATSGQ